jgi:hypothetical protein
MKKTSRKKITLTILKDVFAVCRLDNSQRIPKWGLKGKFFCITKTADELSMVCEQNFVPKYVKAEKGWSALKILGPLPFGLVGILASVLKPLARAGISIFAISTYDTDYILLKKANLKKAIVVLKKSGFRII